MAFEYTFGSLKDMVKTILDRQDITDNLLQFGVYTAFQRIQRVARLPSMEVTQTFTQPAGQDWIPVFENMLELKHVIGPNRTLERKSLDYIVNLPAEVGEARFFARSDEIWQIWPVPETDTDYTIIYYAEFDPMVLDTATNNTVLTAFDVLVYGALSVLGEIYVDERITQWEQRFQQEVQELQIQASEMEFGGSELAIMAPEGSSY